MNGQPLMGGTGAQDKRLDGTQTHCLLVVDDQPMNIQALYRVFAADHRVLMATTGEKALAICHETPPDLILLDVMMAGMDGYQVLQHLKGHPATAGIPVIFVTARNAAEDEALALSLGAVDYIAKPINPAIVRARVRTHLGVASARALRGATLDRRRLLSDMLPLLQASDMRVLELMGRLRASAGGRLSPDLEPLEASIEALDFDRAAGLCHDLLNGVGA